MQRQICSDRRRFLQQTAPMAGGLAAFPALARAAAGSVNEEIRLAIIGLGNKGGHHVQLFSALPGVRIAALREAAPKRLTPRVEKLKQKGVTPFTASDPRRVLERDDVDAVAIAAPNHWHALLTVWALRAGKDVSVEKPVSHNVWEGARMVEEAKAQARVGVDSDKTPFTLRPCPELDPASGEVVKVGAGDAAQLEQARRLARGSYREPFVLPA